ncbi:MAG: DUF6588 family protein, partial [Bacteroidota bacterium]
MLFNHFNGGFMKRISFLGVVILVMTLCVQSFSQGDIGAQLSKVAGKNAENYMSPFLSGLGADLNSGFYHSADLHGTLGFDVGIKMSLALMK